MMDISAFLQFSGFVGIGLLAGIIEATAGGSGLIVLPALLFAGLPPAQAMATSKLQYVFGALTAIFRFHQARLVQWKNILPMVLTAALGGAAGALLLAHTDTALLKALVPLLLVGATLYFIFSPRLSDKPSGKRLAQPLLIVLPIALIGFYDGFFGVGSGSFFVLILIWGLGLAAREATATTKIVDFASAAAALIVLATQQEVLWLYGLALGLGQIAGAWIGSGFVIRRGARFIRPMLIIVSLGLSLKLIYDARTILANLLP